jgi:hypothetical protein
MKSIPIARTLAVIAVTSAFAGCSSWHRMDKTEGTAAGAAGGAVAGAVVAGPVGAVVGGVGGAYAGHETAGKEGASTSTSASTRSSTASAYDPSLVRSAQQALNDKGYNVGAADGQWGPATQDATRRFQQSSGLPATGELDRSTLTALGV